MSALINGSICPVCEKGELRETKKNLVFKYKNHRKRFENETVFECGLCNNEILTREVNKRIEKELTDFRRSIDGLLSSEQLKSIRGSLGLNKGQMAKLLSVNEKTVGRYENGKITQSDQIDKLYRILEAFPSTASILRPDIRLPIYLFERHMVISEKYEYDPETVGTYGLVPNEYFDLEESENVRES